MHVPDMLIKVHSLIPRLKLQKYDLIHDGDRFTFMHDMSVRPHGPENRLGLVNRYGRLLTLLRPAMEMAFEPSIMEAEGTSRSTLY